MVCADRLMSVGADWKGKGRVESYMIQRAMIPLSQEANGRTDG